MTKTLEAHDKLIREIFEGTDTLNLRMRTRKQTEREIRENHRRTGGRQFRICAYFGFLQASWFWFLLKPECCS
ncbi:MAG TPA: hypothetical protein DD856_00745 [Sulfobacillus sp.]|nr:hypothetical protein [Sulfobacillus sp.]